MHDPPDRSIGHQTWDLGRSAASLPRSRLPKNPEKVVACQHAPLLLTCRIDNPSRVDVGHQYLLQEVACCAARSGDKWRPAKGRNCPLPNATSRAEQCLRDLKG